MMKLKADTIRWYVLLGVVALLGSALGIRRIWPPSSPAPSRLVQLRGSAMETLKPEEVYVTDCNGKTWVPDTTGCVWVPPGRVTVFNASTDKILVVVDVPPEGSSPYQVRVPL